jgi:hypothetical protein
MTIWIRNADGEDVGCSSKAWRPRFQGDLMAAKVSSSRERECGNKSPTSGGGEAGLEDSSVKNREDSVFRIRAKGIEAMSVSHNPQYPHLTQMAAAPTSLYKRFLFSHQ